MSRPGDQYRGRAIPFHPAINTRICFAAAFSMIFGNQALRPVAPMPARPRCPNALQIQRQQPGRDMQQVKNTILLLALIGCCWPRSDAGNSDRYQFRPRHRRRRPEIRGSIPRDRKTNQCRSRFSCLIHASYSALVSYGFSNRCA